MKKSVDLNIILKLVVVAFILYGLSFLGYLLPVLNSVLFWIFLLVAAYFTYKKTEYGLLALFFELAIGVKGYLFSFDLLGFVVSLRLALFATVFLIWFYKLLKNKEEVRFAKARSFPLYALFTVVLMLGMIVGLTYGNDVKNLFFDVNGYFYLALAFPLLHVFYERKSLKKLLLVFVAGGVAISAFSIFVALEFTILHQDSRPDLAGSISSELTLDEGDEDEIKDKISHSVTAKDELTGPFTLVRRFENEKPLIYRWTQDVGVAEIAYLAGPFFRVFSPGQIYSLAVFLVLVFLILKKSVTKKNNFLDLLPNLPRSYLYGLAGLTLLTVILGFSRSLWLGLLAAFVFLLFSLPFKKSMKIVFCSFVSLIILVIVMKLIVPSAFELVENRVYSIVDPSTESSGSNRVNMLPPIFAKVSKHLVLGNGFGTTIEYESIVPEKYGTLRVFAFEWAYLDTILEVGIFGLVVYLFFLLKIFNNLSKKGIVYFQAVLFALLIVNLTTPYLNHPLGIGLVLIGLALSEMEKSKIK
ncbi:O-antigen ligase family protein [Patescibacteria group bacterium]|nr:O-antigen ligase family protein [Patescibacteria group bacterium]